MACFEIFQQPGQLMKDYGKILLTLLFFSLVFELPSANAFTGLGPVSGKVYRLDDNSPPLVFGAIIEIRAFAGDDQPNNFVRASVLPAYRVSENLIFNSSLTIRDTTDDDSIDIDYLYADLIKGDSETTLGFRLGHILVPFGVTNLQFEPPMYPGVNRPMFEETLFPKAWSENGVTGFILVGPVQGQLGTLYDDDFGFFARVDTAPAGNGTGFTKPGLGVSIYRGTVAEISEENVNLAELHGAIRFDRFQFAAILTGGLLTDEERIGGSTIVLMYDLFRESFENGAQLPIFVSFEDEKIREIKNDLWTFGLNFKPDQQVVIKTDIAIESGRGRDTDTRFEAGMGLAF